MNAGIKLKQTLLARENEWMSAWQRRDRAAAEAIVADEFMLVSSLGGEVFSKAQWMEAAMGPMERALRDDRRVDLSRRPLAGRDPARHVARCPTRRGSSISLDGVARA